VIIIIILTSRIQDAASPLTSGCPYIYNVSDDLSRHIILGLEQQLEPAALTPGFANPFFELLALGINVASGVIIAISVIRGFIMYIKLLRKSPLEQTKEEDGIKRFVGNGLILALDLQVGGDIIKTILEPSETDLITLGVIVAIRIVLSWSLSRDVKT
jgi:uncharacterized membrane protein